MPDLRNYMTVNEAREYLSLSRQSIHRVARRCRWRTLKLGGARLYMRSDVKKTPTRAQRQSMRGKFI